MKLIMWQSPHHESKLLPSELSKIRLIAWRAFAAEKKSVNACAASFTALIGTATPESKIKLRPDTLGRNYPKIVGRSLRAEIRNEFICPPDCVLERQLAIVDNHTLILI
jgi:hypothetical protein